MSRMISCVRSLGLPMLKNSPMMKVCSRRNFFGGRRDPFTDMSSAIRSMERQMRDIDREMSRIFDELSRNSPIRLGSPFWWRDGRQVPMRKPGDDKTAFRLTLDVSNFKPENIKVAVKNRTLTVRARQEETSPDGSKMEREYTHQSTLPDDVDVEAVRSELNPNGSLIIEAPLHATALPKEIPVVTEDAKNEKKT